MFAALTAYADAPVPIYTTTEAEQGAWLESQSEALRVWVRAADFKAKPGQVLLLPDPHGTLGGVLLGASGPPELWTFAGLPEQLPPAAYHIATPLPTATAATQVALGWLLGHYRFERYRSSSERAGIATLVLPEGADAGYVEQMATSIYLVRDLVNTPAADLGPGELADAARSLATEFQAQYTVTSGDALLDAGYPAVHAVGRAAARAPHLLDLSWGEETAPKVTLVGKGVCFDSGGLDLKPASGMRNMKKDMGGAATVLGLARAVIATGLRVRLRVLIPAVENAVSGNAFRPGDILSTRRGLTVEVGNTDAEGRLVLADALAAADSDAPGLLIDCATLTGAARVALGPDLPALFTPDDELAERLLALGREHNDPLWQLPLWQPYAQRLDSTVADLNNVTDDGQAGAITAALFLSRFVTQTRRWCHIDLYAWNDKPRPGRPAGGEAYSLRALYALIAQHAAA